MKWKLYNQHDRRNDPVARCVTPGGRTRADVEIYRGSMRIEFSRPDGTDEAISIPLDLVHALLDRNAKYAQDDVKHQRTEWVHASSQEEPTFGEAVEYAMGHVPGVELGHADRNFVLHLSGMHSESGLWNHRLVRDLPLADANILTLYRICFVARRMRNA